MADPTIESIMTESIESESAETTTSTVFASITANLNESLRPRVRRVPGNISIYEFIHFQRKLWYDWLHDIGYYTYRRFKTAAGQPEQIIDDATGIRSLLEYNFEPVASRETVYGKDFDVDSDVPDKERKFGTRDGNWADNAQPYRIMTSSVGPITRMNYDNVEYVKLSDPDDIRRVRGYLDPDSNVYSGPNSFEEYHAAILGIPDSRKEVVEIPEFYQMNPDRILSDENSDAQITADSPNKKMPNAVTYELWRREPAALASSSPFDTNRKNWKHKLSGTVIDETTGRAYAIYSRFWDNLIAYGIVARGGEDRDVLSALLEDFYTTCSGLFIRAGIVQTIFMGQTKDMAITGMSSPSAMMKDRMMYAFFRTQEFRIIGPIPTIDNLVLEVLNDGAEPDDQD